MENGKPRIVGPILLWIAAIIWCTEIILYMFPTGLYFLLVPVGLVFLVVEAFKNTDWKPTVLGLASVIPPVILLVFRGGHI